MAIVSTIGTGLGVIDRIAGGRLGGVVDSINPFKKSEPNAGSSSFVDALDNYEKISTSKARSILPEFTSLIAQGANDSQLAEFIAKAGGEPGNGAGYRGSWKWQIVQEWIDKTRSIQDSDNTGRVNSGAESSGGSIIPGSVNMGGINTGLIFGGLALGVVGLGLILRKGK